MKIKKVDDKSMVIHTKKKAKIHTHEPKKASIKASNIYTVDRSPKIKGSKIATTENKKFRRGTIHPVDNAKKGMFRQYRAALKESKQSIKTKNSSIKVAGAAGAQTALSQISNATNITKEIADAGFRLFKQSYNWQKPIRSVGIRGADLVNDNYWEQLDLFHNAELRDKMMKMDAAVDDIRRRFGFYSIQRGLMLGDTILSAVNAKEEHTVHPHGYF